MQINKLPTGYLFSADYSKGKLETLSIGDYGKAANVKADFLGYNKEINGVANGTCMPLSEKWVVTLSSQYGCPQKCTFCDVPNMPYKGNATAIDLQRQLENAISMFPNVRYVERLNIHYARMGEPLLNDNVLQHAVWVYRNKAYFRDQLGLSIEVVHPVLTTSLPKRLRKPRMVERLMAWIEIKNDVYNGQAGLQFSINSTNEEQRQAMFGGDSITLEEFADIAKDFPMPLGRKYCLNFAYASGYEVDGSKLRKLFDPEKFMCKITPIHNNNACTANGIETVDGYNSYTPYKEAEESLKAAGFDVLVFVPSMDEEDGLVTCGNLVLGGGELKVPSDTIIKIEGQ